MAQHTRGAVLDFLDARFKGRMASEDATVVVALTQTDVIGGDVDRVSLTFVNLGAGNVFVAPHPEVNITRGIRLGAQGGFLSMNVDEDALMPALQWWAVSSVGGDDLYVLSVRREALFTLEGEGA